MTGDWPRQDGDHMDLNKTDNSWENVRNATRSQNMANIRRHKDNASGLKWVSRKKDKWRATIWNGEKQISLGSFECPAAAHFAAIVEADNIHGEFARAR